MFEHDDDCVTVLGLGGSPDHGSLGGAGSGGVLGHGGLGRAESEVGHQS
jgi:hypothetical protein